MEMEYFRPSSLSSVVNIALLAIMTALAVVMTLVLRIPYPGTGGYFNLGDAAVMLSGLLLGPVGGFVAGGVGSALADVIGGYTYWAPITLIVKGLEGMAVGFFSFRVRKNIRLGKWDFFGILVAAVVMLAGYFVAEAILIGMVVAIGELVTVNLAQVTIGGLVTLLIGPTIRSYLRTVGLEPPESLENSADNNYGA